MNYHTQSCDQTTFEGPSSRSACKYALRDVVETVFIYDNATSSALRYIKRKRICAGGYNSAISWAYGELYSGRGWG